MNLPDSVEAIGSYACSNCANLVSFTYPRNWNSSGSRIFEGCSKLTSVTVPEGIVSIPEYAFYSSDYLKNVELPGTLTTIGKSAFSNCPLLENPVFPEGLLKIGNYAFSSCIKISDINLPDTVTTIGSYAFSNCSNLKYFRYPMNWNSAGSRIFEGCSKLTSVTVPEGIVTIPDYAFYSANYLRTVTLPGTLVKIGQSAFSECKNLRFTDLPARLNTIGNYAFSGCTKLRLLILPNSVVSIGYNAFNNCPLLNIYCPYNPDVLIYMMDNGIEFELYGSIFTDEAVSVLNRNSTYYVANTVAAKANGYISINLAYEFKDSVKNAISNIKLKIRIPSNVSLIEKTVMLDGVRVTGYDYSNSILTIDLKNTKGRVSFDITPSEDGKISSYALMTFRNGNKSTQELIDVVNDSIPVISIQSDNVVNKSTVQVKGVGPADADILLYLDGKHIKTVHSKKSGSYEGTIEIPTPKNYNTYVISASATENGNSVYSSTEVQYCVEAPTVQSFSMDYNGNNYSLTGQGTLKPTVTFVPGKEFSFKVKMTNPDQVDTVYICSTRSNVTKRMEAKYNEKTGMYEANGFFDPANTSYVPGTMTVEFSPVKEKVSFYNSDIDYSSDKYVNGGSTPIKAALAGKLEDCLEDLFSDDKRLSGIIKIADIDAQLDFNILTDIIPSYLDPENAGEYGYEAVEDDYGAKLYLKFAEYAEDKVRGEILDFAHESVTEFLIDGKYITAAMDVDAYFNFMEVFGYVDKLVTWDNNRIDLNEAKQAVLSSGMSDTQKADALHKIDLARMSNNATVAVLALSIVLKCAGIALPFPVNVILPLFSLRESMYVKDILGEFGYLEGSESKGAQFDFRWKIDPSGYVYDSETNERIAGATVTAYWIPYDDSDTFFDVKPDDSEYGTLWDAYEWDQINPIVSDATGCYAWDVPEGWWRVRYEKDGYETVWSEWLPVPPPQTDVNVGMTAVPGGFEKGDLDMNGEVDASDLTLLARIVARIDSASGEVLKLADINGDGEITAEDLTKLARIVAKID